MTGIAVAVIAGWMLIGGALHVIAPTPFFVIVPDWMPERAVVFISGLVELLIGVAVLVPRLRALAGAAFAALCLGFLPLHVWDFFRPDPVFPVPWGAAARIFVQVLLIGLGLFLWRGGRMAATSERKMG